MGEITLVGKSDLTKAVKDMQRMANGSAMMAKQFQKAGKAGSKSAKRIETDYEKATRRLNGLNKAIKRHEFEMRRSGQATDRQTRRLKAMKDQARTLETQLGRTGRAGAAGMREASGHGLKFLGTLTGIGSAIGGVYAVARQLRAEWEYLKNQQARAGATQMTVGEAAAAALLNKPGHVDTKALEAIVKKQAGLAKVPEAQAWNMAGAMLSAMGGMSLKQWGDAFGQVLKIQALGGAGVEGKTLGQGMLNLMQQGAPTAEHAGGFIRGIGAASNVVALKKQVRGVVPVVSAARDLGFTQEAAGELFAYATHRSGDTEGEMSSTGTVAFMRWLQKLQAEGMIQQGGLAGVRELRQKLAGMGKAERDLFLNAMPGEGKVRGAWTGILTGQDDALSAFAAARRQVLGPEAAENVGLWRSFETDVNRIKQTPVRKVSMGFDKAVEQVELENFGGMGGVVREKLQKLRDAMPGQSKLYNDLDAILTEFDSRGMTKDSIEHAIRAVERLHQRGGYGYKFKRTGPGGRALTNVKAPIYYRDLPAGSEHKDATSWWSSDMPAGWDTPGGHRLVENPEYKPAVGAALDSLVRYLGEVQRDVQAQKDADRQVIEEQTQAMNRLADELAEQRRNGGPGPTAQGLE